MTDCDRCGRELPGYGVLYGAMISDMDVETGKISDLIVCYECWPAVLDGLACEHEPPFRAAVFGTLVTDLAEDQTDRYLFFCRENDCRDAFLGRIEGDV